MSDITHEHEHSCLELECGPQRRNRYFKGKRMSWQAFALEQDYLVRRRHLLNHALYGWGVVGGFHIDPSRATVGPGLALDRHGRELVLDEECRLDPNDCFLEEGPDARPGPGRWLLRVHYAERLVGEQLLPADCGCDEVEWNEVCETMVFSLKRLGPDEHCPPGEPPCPHCECTHKVDCCPEPPEHCRPHEHGSEHGGQYGNQPAGRGGPQGGEHGSQHDGDHGGDRHGGYPDPGHGYDRHSHSCECQWAEWSPLEDDREHWKHWRRRKLRFAWCDPIPIACLHLRHDDCNRLVIDRLDPCAPRRLVKPNDTLFDLIRGCDLTRIADVSWRDWHRPGTLVPWEKFREKFHNSDDTPLPPLPPDQHGSKPRVTDFKVWFTRPVEAKTVRWDCFVMSAIALDKGTGWGRVKRVPIVGVATEMCDDKVTPERLTHWAKLVVDRRWLADEVSGAWSDFDDGPTTVEIEVRGDYILDCHGQPVSGAAIGLHPFASGNGSPGGTFVSRFRVSSKPDTE
jgi:hypothetical protein